MIKRKSLTRQIIFLFCVLTAGTILICWILNTTLLERYYVMQKKAGMIESYQTILKASESGKLDSSDFDVTFENICLNGNIKIVIFSEDGSVVRSSANDMSTMQEELILSVFERNPDIVAEGESYQLIQRTDSRLGSDYLILLGTLDDDDIILMRTALESIRESAMISNHFLLFVGLISIAAGCLVGGYIACRITRPILMLTEISKRMVNLDFEAKYVPGAWKEKNSNRSRRDNELQNEPCLPCGLSSDSQKLASSELPVGNEIDQLGEHFNQMSDNLERTICELKAANIELQKDIEKKEQIDEMRKEFLSNVSHELKTPLALIQGYAEGLQECINDDEESRNFYCEVIIDEASKMNRMVKKLLTLNQLEFGNEQIEMTRFNITELIIGVTNSSRILMEQNGITLDLDGLEEAYVWGDEFMIEEVITNYLSNAIHHCEGEKQIRFSYEYRENLLRISVFNTGTPIPEEDIDQIWVKFYKVDKARTRAYGGSGIGLSIVKAIMDSMWQQCGVINHDDGVEFWLELETR